MTLLSLRAGRLALDLAPQAGGSIARFAVDGKGDLLRRAHPEAVASGRSDETACYPLVPYSNRIAGGRFVYDGEDIVVPSNWPRLPHPMHGDGWSHAWRVERQDTRSAVLDYQHDGRDGWPFRYRARQSFCLDEDRLVISLSLENLESRPVPGGIGLHPFFVRDPDTDLTCRTDGVWLTNAEVIPTERVPVPAAWSFASPRRVEGLALDHCFDGWDGQALIRWPSHNVALDIRATPPFDQLVIYTPSQSGFFCVEPVSHANGAIGQTRLSADAVLTGEIVFTVKDI